MKSDSNSLGAFLQTAREQKGFTLRTVEQLIGVSNAYISQLESDKIKKPSPIILHKLSDIYEISYSDLLILSGYPLPNIPEIQGASKISSRIGPITNEEEAEIIEYLHFLRSRRKTGGR